MTSDARLPPYGRRLTPCLLDSEAEKHPNRLFAVAAKSADLSDGFREVSYGQMANAVNSVVYDLIAALGEPEHPFETLTYIGTVDLRYNIIFYAAVKCGYKVFFPSPRNPPPVNISLMEQTQSQKVAYAPEMEKLVQAFNTSRTTLKSFVLRSLNELLDTHGPHFNYAPNVDEALHHPVLVLHSSGSTGLPKPVTMTHGSFAVIDNDRNFPTMYGRQNLDFSVWNFEDGPSLIYEPFPPFHFAGFTNKIIAPLYTNAIPAFGPATRLPSGPLAKEMLTKLQIRGTILPPSVVEDVLQEPDGIQCFKGLSLLAFTGGPLSQAAGNAISQVTSLCQFYGSTELGQVRQLVPQGENWPYMEFHPKSNLELQPSDDDAFELVIFGSKDTVGSEALNHNYPDVKEWRTKDLFKPHPTNKGLWRFHSRLDDLIVLSNGEKLNPVPFENQLQSAPEVSGALVAGQGRHQPSLLLEVKRKDGQSDDTLIEALWSTIELANKNMPGYGQVTRSMIQLASPEKPFARASKGTVVRKLTEKLYAAEIEDLYAGTSRMAATTVPTLLSTAFTAAAVKGLVRAILPSSLDVERLKDSDDFYLAGLDSLQTVETVRRLKTALVAHRSASQLSWLNTGTIYRNPSIDELTRLLLSFLNDGTVTEQKSRVAEISDTIEQFARLLPSNVKHSDKSRMAETLVVAITGTTGALGSYMLDRLSRHPRITKIYCLNRSATAQRQWQERKSSTQTANHSSPAAETSFLTINLARPNFGLSMPEWTDLTTSTDIILHNAWKVDFNQNLSSFADNIQSVITVAQWTHSSPKQPRLVFLSSIAAVGPWNPSFSSTVRLSVEGTKSEQKTQWVPEAFLPDQLANSMENGYGESKAVAEHLLHRYFTGTHMPVTVIRAGLIGTPATAAAGSGDEVGKAGRGLDRDIAPAIFRTCKAIKMIPKDLPDVDWIAVDTVAEILSEICLHEASTTERESATDLTNLVKYYHIVNPNPKPWSEFIPLLQKRIDGSDVNVVPLAEWVGMLQSVDLAAEPEVAENIPALRMLGLFEMLVRKGTKFARYRTENAEDVSETLRNLRAVEDGLMEKWIGEALDGK